MSLDSLMAFWPALLAVLARSVVVLALAAIAAKTLLARAPASSRYLAWASALGMLLILPIAGAVMPDFSLPVIPATATVDPPPVEATPALAQGSTPASATAPDASAAALAASTHASAPVSISVTVTPSADVEPVAAGTIGRVTAWLSGKVNETLAGRPGWPLFAVAVWALVAIALLARLGLSHLQLRTLRRTAWPVRDSSWVAAIERAARALGVRRPVSLLVSSETSVPMTWGTRAPVVLLPADSDGWPAERRHAVLVHELAHVARRDALGHDVARIAAALYWPNPLVWMALRAMRVEGERACDDLVLGAGLRASAYAEDLLDIARGLGRRPVAVAALAMARRSELEGRLLAILDPSAPRGVAGRRARVSALGLALALVVPLSALTPVRPAVAHPLEAPEPAIPPTGPGPVTVPSAAFPRTAVSRVSRPSRASVTAEVPPTPSPPPAPAAPTVEREPAHVPAPRASAPLAVQPDQRETLIAVAIAARRMTSDYEKAELLLEILAHYVNDDSLRAAYLATAATLRGNHERQRVLLGLLGRDSLKGGGAAQFLKITGEMTGAHEKSLVLGKFIAVHPLTTPALREAFFNAAATLKSSHEMQMLLVGITKERWFDAKVAGAVLGAAKAMPTSHAKADVLVAVARAGVLSDAAARQAYIDAAETLTSDADYRRAMAAAAGRPR